MMLEILLNVIHQLQRNRVDLEREVDTYIFALYEKDKEIEFLQKQNKRLRERIKWLEERRTSECWYK
jgi:hypothetical protein